ncbi:MAG: hypothetical protein U0232_10765 [Thermomicrobiales bacterium]
MNEEQRAVLAAVGRMEQGSGTLIDEYTVAKEVGVVRGDIPSQEYVHSQERAQIRQLLEELERGGMIRVSREGYWRPRTTLVGRRAWQDPHASLLPTAVVMPPQPPPLSGRGGSAPIPGIFGDDDDDDEPPQPRWASQRQPREAEPEREEAPQQRAWPTWWPAALRFGDPGLTPLIGAAAAGLLALLLIVVVVTRVAGGRGPAPTPTISAVAQTATTVAGLPPPAPPTATQPVAAGSASSVGPLASARASSSGPAQPTQPRQPTATAGPQATKLRIANTELQGAFLYATPAGERTTLAVPEGTLVEVAGPDERDTQGATGSRSTGGTASTGCWRSTRRRRSDE